MLALTLHQPVASMMGAPPFKDVENRTWEPPMGVLGTRIAIHAGSAWSEKYAVWISQRWQAMGREPRDPEYTDRLFAAARGVRGCVVSTAVVGACWNARTLSARQWVSITDENRADGVPSAHHVIEASPWFLGPVGWLLWDFRHLRTPVDCKGHQKLWRLPPDVEARVLAEGG